MTGWDYEVDNGLLKDRHEGRLAAEFGNGDYGIVLEGSGIPAGHLVAEQHCGVVLATRPVSEVIGWRVMCDCSMGSYGPLLKTWASDRFWSRVASPAQHDPAVFRLYASDEDVLRGVLGDADDAARELWWREHIADIDTAAAVTRAYRRALLAEGSLNDAVKVARQAGLSWTKVGAAVCKSAPEAHERWAKYVGETGATSEIAWTER